MLVADHIAALTAGWPWLNELGDQAPGIAASWSPPPREVSFLVRHQAFACRPSVHRRAQLVIAVKGSGQVAVGRGRFQLRPGETVLVAPFQSHHYPRFAQKRICWLFLHWLEDRPERLAGLNDRRLRLDEAAWERVLGFVRSADAWLAGDLDLGGECDAWLALLLAALRRAGAGNVGRLAGRVPVVPDLVQRCRSLINDWIEKPFTLADLANELGISEPHLRRAFRRHQQVALGQTVRACRLERARHLLTAGDQSVADVARATGFTSLPAFSRAFRSVHHLSPSAWRQQHQLPVDA